VRFDPVAAMEALLSRNADGYRPLRAPDRAAAQILLDRTEKVPLFAHSYSFILNMDHGGLTPQDIAEFAYVNELAGLCLHVNDGGRSSLARMTAKELEAFAALMSELGLALHLEISSTLREEVDQVVALAQRLEVANIRFYARHAGPLDRVMETIYADLCYAAELANRHDLNFDYEQHEDLRAAEIATLLDRVADRRLNVLFDYTNSWNAYEEPLDALKILSPWVRQVHIKGGRKTIEGDGWGQIGVPQGSPEDELPSAMLAYELLLLGRTPQVIAFAMENEVGYYAPPFRRANDAKNPEIAFRHPSETPLDNAKPLARQLREERRFAQQQVRVNRDLIAEFREAAMAIVG
jgi:hypothetical protein